MAVIILLACSGTGETVPVTVDTGLVTARDSAYHTSRFDRILAMLFMENSALADTPDIVALGVIAIYSLDLEVSGPDIEKSIYEIPLVTGRMTVDVQAGDGRLFVVILRGISTSGYTGRLYGGRSVADLEEGEPLTVEISMRAIPQNISAIAQSQTDVSLSWNQVSSATSYRVYRSDGSPAGPFAYITEAATYYYADGYGPNPNQYLVNGKTYYYRVSAMFGTTEGEQSDISLGATATGF